MKRRISPSWFALALLATALPLLAQPTTASSQLHQCPQYKFQLSLPADWKTMPASSAWMAERYSAASETGSQPLMRAVVGVPPALSQPMKLNEQANAVLAYLKEGASDLRPGAPMAATLGGETAWKVELTGRASGSARLPLRGVVLSAVHNNQSYVIGVIAPESQWQSMGGSFDTMISSFAFTTTGK